MSKPKCPNCGTNENVVKSDSGYHYSCQECGDIFDKHGDKIPKK